MKLGSPTLPFLLLATAILSGCASSGPPLPPSLEVARPVTDLRALRKGDKVYLAWTIPTKTTDHESIRHPGPTLICRGRDAAMNDCGMPVGQTPPVATPEKSHTKKEKEPEPKTTAIYADSLPASPRIKPEDEITYVVEALNDRHRSAGLSNPVTLPLLPAVPPPGDFVAQATAAGVKISWSCAMPPSMDNVRYRLRVLRRLMDGQSDSQSDSHGHGQGDDKIAEPDLSCGSSGDAQGQFVLDSSFEWEKTYQYRAAVVTIISAPGKTAVEIEGDDTPSVKVFAHDVFPPAVPSGAQAVFSGPGQAAFVDLIWSPDTEADLAGYNVYRREEGGQAVKINSEIVKPPAYRDAKVDSGKTYYYSVSAVDVRGNESNKSEETSESVP
jgi:hypothetical protein